MGTEYEGLAEVVSIELPFNVRNGNRALGAVGGPPEIAKVAADPEAALELRLRDDRFHHPVTSRRAETHNMILEIEVPSHALKLAGGDVRRALALAGPGQYRAQPVYMATTNMRFREMADFQYYTGASPFLSKVEPSVLAGDLDAIRKLELDNSKIVDTNAPDVFPPPRFSQQAQPFMYNYRQNPAVTLVSTDEGETKLVNKSLSRKIVSSILLWGDDIPTVPPSDLDQHPRAPVLACIEEIKKLFDQRPCYTRRALEALVDPAIARYLRFALPYVTYFYKSGPWRSSYIKYGADPSTDSSYAQYQVEHFRIKVGEDQTERSNLVFKFDGVTFPTTKMLQLCDVDDGYLGSYIYSTDLRESVHPDDGWYPSETIAIIRRVLRTELLNARDGNPRLEPHQFARLRDEAIESNHKERGRANERQDSEAL